MLLPATNLLRQIIRREIRTRGAISFARFMELSLYCPEFGYYERLGNTPGKRGDYYTSVSVGSLFGELLAFQFTQWFSRIPPGQFHLVEAGAHDGRLAADILSWLKSRQPRLFSRLEYWIIEPSPNRRLWQERTLKEFSGNIRWFESLNAVPCDGIRGVIFSNELLDAMPAHRVGWDARQRTWIEWGVGLEGDGFVWVRLPENGGQNASDKTGVTVVSDPDCRFSNLPAKLLDVLPDRFVTEISSAATEWWRQAAKVLKTGKLLTIDYGLRAEEFFLPSRAGGTLRAHHRHQSGSDLLARPGEQDLTAHVNFTGLQEAGESAGLKTDGFHSQAQFLTEIAETAWRQESAFGRRTPGQARQFQTLTHPEHLGRSFKILVQSR